MEVNLDWIVGIAAGIVFILIIIKMSQRQTRLNYIYSCPKCGGSDYFMSTRNVMKGVGGIWGNRGGTKQFPVCRKCDEIMEGK